MKLPKVACGVALLIAAIGVFAALWSEIVVLPAALIPLGAAIGILRKRVWAAYGYGLFLAGQFVVALIVLTRADSGAPRVAIVGAAAFSLLLAAMFVYAGRSLSRQTATTRGLAWPWVAITIVTTLPLLFVQPFVMPSASMEKTLLIGDRIFVQRLPKPTPALEMMIAHHYPIDRNQVFVKRIVGMPGDRIRIVNKVLYRNGNPVQEPFAIHGTEFVDTYRDNFPSEPNVNLPAPAMEMLAKNVVNGEVVVPEGRYFVLGDNRDDSLDSRYWGFLTLGDIIGKPVLIYHSEEQPAGQAAQSQGLRPHRVRWNRLFRTI